MIWIFDQSLEFKPMFIIMTSLFDWNVDVDNTSFMLNLSSVPLEVEAFLHGLAVLVELLIFGLSVPVVVLALDHAHQLLEDLVVPVQV